MKVRILFASFLIFLDALQMIAAQVTQSPKPPFSLNIEMTKTAVKVSSPVIVIVHYKNTSDHNLFFAVGLPGRQIHLKLLNGKGKDVEDTAYGRKNHGDLGAFSGSVFRAVFPLGKISNEEIDLNKEYDLNKTGHYIVQAQLWDHESQTTVISNAITITITQ